MNSKQSVQFIEHNGHPEWAVIPYRDYLRLIKQESSHEELVGFYKDLNTSKEEFLPELFANRLIDGENAIRVWREYRRMTQTELANLAHISKAYLSQLENDQRKASSKVLAKLANLLNVMVDDLI